MNYKVCSPLHFLFKFFVSGCIFLCYEILYICAPFHFEISIVTKCHCVHPGELECLIHVLILCMREFKICRNHHLLLKLSVGGRLPSVENFA